MGQEESEVLRIQKNDSVKSNNDPAVVKLPFKIISALTQAFTHLDNVFTVDFSKLFSNTVKEQIMNRLDTMTERDLKDVDKDEIQNLIGQMRDFLAISMTRSETAEFVETTML